MVKESKILMQRRRGFLIGVLFPILLISHTSPIQCSSPRVFEFGIHGSGSSENFLAVTSDPNVQTQIESQLTLPIAERTLHINGAIDYASGGFNYEWHWHFLPDQWELAEYSIELCDGLPSMVEQDLTYWVGVLGYFCPWGSYVVGEIEYKCGDANSDNGVNIGDVVYLLNYVFRYSECATNPPIGCPPDYMSAGDANCDGRVNIGDAIYLLCYQFRDPGACLAPCAYCP